MKPINAVIFSEIEGLNGKTKLTPNENAKPRINPNTPPPNEIIIDSVKNCIKI